MLKFTNVTREFRLDEENTIAPVNDLTLNIESGEFIVIIGRSGTGKTTLLNLAAGLIRPTSGSVVIDDEDISGMTDRQVSSLRSRKIGFVFQFPSLLPPLTILDNVTLPSIFGESTKNRNKNGTAEIRERAEDILKTLGLASKLDVYPRQLSAGEQKRVVIARSLINKPQLILADEPTSDLDSRTEKEVMTIIRDINAGGVTFLIVTHNLDLVEFADRAFEMENGKLNEINQPVLN